MIDTKEFGTQVANMAINSHLYLSVMSKKIKSSLAYEVKRQKEIKNLIKLELKEIEF